jgi:hypothetical protein
MTDPAALVGLGAVALVVAAAWEWMLSVWFREVAR